MSENELQHMVKMINQISINMPHNLSEDELADKIAAHITSFWAKTMRVKICQNQETVEHNLTPAAKKALQKVSSQLAT